MNENTNPNRSNWLVGIGIVLALLIAVAALAFTLTNQPEPAVVDNAAIAQEVAELLPTPAAVPTIDLGEVEDAAAAGAQTVIDEFVATQATATPMPEPMDEDDGEVADEEVADTAEPEVTTTATPDTAESPNIITHNDFEGVPGWSVSGVPEMVDGECENPGPSELHTHAEMANRPLEGDVAWTAIPGFECTTGDPGVYNTHNEEDAANNPSARLITPLSQHLFTQSTETVPVEEGAVTWINACGMTVQVIQDQDGEEVVLQEVTLECVPGHSWFFIVDGLSRDYTTPYDKNLSLRVTLDEAFGHAQMFAQGSKLSYGYLNDNVNSAMVQDSCGADGCPRVSLMELIPETGQFSVAHKSSQTAEYEFVASNTGYAQPE